MRKLLLLPIAVFFITFSLSAQSKTENLSEKFKKERKEKKAKAGIKIGAPSDDLEGAMLYEFNMTKDPATGKIPVGIRKAELAQANSIVQQQGTNFENLGTYSFQGPDNLGGRTRAVQYDVRYNGTTNRTIIAGGVSGGVFKSTDDGATWVRKNPIGDLFSVSSIVQDPRSGSEDTWYYAGGEWTGNSASAAGASYRGKGVYKSTDNGETWTHLPASNTGSLEVFDHRADYVVKLVVDPTNGNLYMAAMDAIYRSTDGGTTWGIVLTSGSGSFGTGMATDIVVTPGGRFYAAFAGTSNTSPTDMPGVWTSTTGASASWTKIAGSGSASSPAGWNANGTYGRVVLAYAPSDVDKVFAAYWNGITFTCGAPAPEAELYRWSLAGGSWTDLSATLPDEAGCLAGNDPFAVQGGYDLVIAVKPDDASTLFLGGTNAYRSADGGATWVRIGGYASPASYALYASSHPDIHVFTFPPTSSTTMLCGNDGGIQRTTANMAATVAWTQINSGFRTYQYYYVDVDPRVGNAKVIGGAQDNGSTRNIGGTGIDFESVMGGDGVSVGLTDLIGGIQYEYVGFQNGEIIRRDATLAAGFGTLITPTGEGGTGLFVTLFKLDPDNTERLYYANDNVLYRTTSGSTVTSASWTSMSGIATAVGAANDISAIALTRGAYSAATSSIFLGTSNGKVYRLDDPTGVAAGTAPVDITGAGFPATGYVSSISVNPRNDDTVLVTFSNYGVTSVFWTGNANSATPTWTAVEGPLTLPSYRSSAIAVTTTGVQYFVGTSAGLYHVSGLPGTTSWTQEGPTDIGNALVSHLALRPSDNKLLVGTHGYGMWSAMLPGGVSNTITLTSAAGTDAQTVCISTPITTITYATTGATGATFSGLPTGVTGSWAGDVVTISGTPSVSGSFSYTVTLTGGSGTGSATGSITVSPVNTVTLTSAAGTDAQTVFVSTPITTITYATTGATGATVTGLPAGVTGSWSANVVTISGSPSATGVFNYTVTLTGGCGTVTATGSITVNAGNTIILTSAAGTDAQTVCINTPITTITYATTGATGATFSGLPTGVTGSWAGDVVTISGTPSVSGSFSYTVTLTGGSGTGSATGSITVSPVNTVTLTSAAGTDAQTVCISTPITTITYSTTGATGATVTGLPTGVTGGWSANVVTISGTPSVSGSFSYTVTLTGGCGTVTATGSITVTANNTVTLTSAAGTDAQTVSLGSPITTITYATTGATGATVTGLPAGVTGGWSANVVTISGTPAASGVFNYTVTLTGGCGTVTATGSITVTAGNTITLTSAPGTDAQTVCINTAITNITYSTTGATGATFSGLPAGVTGAWAANVVTISGTPSVAGVFNYTVTLTGGSNTGSATGSITVTANNTITLTSAPGTNNQTVCINTAITTITYSTTGATGATVTGLPAGVTGGWAANVVTISGTPSASGVFNYTVTLTGGCGTVTATGSITVNANNTVTLTSAAGTNAQTVCISSPITTITYATTGATGATVTGLPAGVSGSWSANVVTISGTPGATGTFNYTVTLTGGCGTVTTTGSITVLPNPTVNPIPNDTVCNNSIAGPYNFTSPTPGTTFSWTNSNTSIGLGASGSGNIPAFTATNATTAPVTATVTVTPRVNYALAPASAVTNMGSGFGTDLINCINGTGLTSFPSLSASHSATIPSNSWVSSGTLTGTVTFNLGGTATINGLAFWNQNDGGPGSAGSTGINGVLIEASINGVSYTPIPGAPTAFAQVTGPGGPPQVFSFAPVNAAFVRFTISGNHGDPSQTGFAEVAFSSGCTGTPRTFNITVNPSGQVNQVPNQTVCRGQPTAPVNFTTTTPGTIFSWTNNNTSIGLAAQGQGNIPSFIAQNPTTVQQVATITVNPTYGSGGIQQTQTFNFTGAPVSWVVPTGVTSIAVKAWGGQGNSNALGVIGGLGGYAEGTLAVTPGQTLWINVGGGGTTAAAGGFNGGGAGGVNSGCANANGGGGGGASDVRIGSNTLGARAIVAAGGGGAGGNRVAGCGRGAGGGGGAGYYGGGGGAGWPGVPPGGPVPTGGTQSAGGAGGVTTWTAGGPTNGTAGALGVGGTGGVEVSSNQGGSATATSGGVGGGLTGANGSWNSSNNWTGQSGAGGSSYLGGVSAGVTTSGVNSGNGRVEFNYAAGGLACAGNTMTFTITVNPNPSLVIVADPGTTLCEGDPTLLTVYNGTGGSATIPLPPQNATFTGNVRGYWFTAPSNFTMTSLRVPTDASSGNQSIAVVRFNGATPPPAFPGTTNAFTTLFLTQNNPAAGTIPVNIPIAAGEVIGIMGYRATVNSYSTNGPQTTNINGTPVTLTRMGMQFPLTTTAPQNIWQEAAFPISRVEFSYNTLTTTGIATGNFLWSPAAGLSSTTTNPVAASPMQTTTYTVRRTTVPGGCIDSAQITITVNQRPRVTQNPSNTTVCQTGTATFTVGGVATGITYQWQVSTTGVGGPYVNITAGPPYSGETTATLTVSPVTLAMNGYAYRCVLGGVCPPGVPPLNVSSGAVLSVNPLPVVSVSPASTCGGVPGTNGVLLTATAPGATSFTWSPLAGLFTNAAATIAYTGGNSATVYAAPTVNMIYTVTATIGSTGCSDSAKAVVNYTPAPPTVNPPSVTMCENDAAVQLCITSSLAPSPFVSTYTRTGVNKAYTNNQTGIKDTINVPLSPLAQITNTQVAFNITHTWAGDNVIVLKAPNGQVLNLDYFLSNTGGTGPTSGFTNTRISSQGTAALSSGSSPYNGVFRADAQMTATANGPTGPTGMTATTPNWSALYSQPNGNWILGIYDGFAGDDGLLTSWSLTFNYLLGTPASGVWSPAAGLFRDAAATIPYVAGDTANCVWARPLPFGLYPYQVRVSTPVTPAQFTTGTPFTQNNGNYTISFNVRNNNSFPIRITGIESETWNAGAATVQAWYKASAINGPPGAYTNANGWFQFGSGSITGTTTLQTFMSGLTLQIPAGQTYGIMVQAQTAAGGFNLKYSTIAAGTYTYTAGNVDLVTGTNIGYGGVNIPGAPTFTPRGFRGNIIFEHLDPSLFSCTSQPRTVNVTVNQKVVLNPALPVPSTVCTDKVATFSVATTAGSAPISYQWQVSTNSGVTWANVSGGVYSGNNAATLTITAPPVSMSGYLYRCIVQGALPCTPTTSASARLTVNPLPVVVISASPYTSLFPGLVTTLSSTVSPNAAATYTWLRDGVAVAGANTGTLVRDVDGLGSYRLRVTDVNGCTSTSNEVVLKDSASGKCFLYPNPNSGKFQVRYHSVASNVLPRTLTVYDAKGDRVFTQRYTIGRPYDRMDVDMRAYGKGLYWVEIGDLNGNRLAMCRVVIQ